MHRPPRQHRDPHAHAIRPPGRRLLTRVPLRFVWSTLRGDRKRAGSASLNLVSFIDILVVTVLFLLSSFSASGQCPGQNVDIPSAVNGIDMIDAPMIAVNGNQILVDGVLAGSTRAVEETGRSQNIEELSALLRAKRELWKSVRPGAPPPEACVLQIDKDVPAIVVKSVFRTAASAGYPNVSFMVEKAAGGG